MKRKQSIITDDLETDFLDGSLAECVHHCIHGTANRKLADEDGLTVGLTNEHHTGQNGVHFNQRLDTYLKQLAEMSWIIKTMKDKRLLFEDAQVLFIRRYGKNWL